MVKIKICGLQRLEDINIVNRYKPDYIGFVFAKSKRKVSHNMACELKNNLDSNILSVGVFVNATHEEILKLYDENIINMAQLHGSESEEYIINLKESTNNRIKIIKAVEIDNNANLNIYDNSVADYLLFDSGKGSGKTFNWNLIQNKFKKDFFIAGGLDSSNICKAIRKFNPYGVDLSSSLETNSYKDENKIREIMEVIR